MIVDASFNAINRISEGRQTSDAARFRKFRSRCAAGVRELNQPFVFRSRRRQTDLFTMESMAYIRYVESAGEVRRMANILRIHGINPPVLEAHLRLYRAVMFGPSPLTRLQRETLAVAVSGLNGCHY
jgi:hypothetical protein